MGVGQVVFQIAVPLGQRDADCDGEPLFMPTVTLPGGVEGPPSESPCLVIPMNSSHECRAAVLELCYRPDALHLAVPGTFESPAEEPGVVRYAR